MRMKRLKAATTSRKSQELMLSIVLTSARCHQCRFEFCFNCGEPWHGQSSRRHVYYGPCASPVPATTPPPVLDPRPAATEEGWVNIRPAAAPPAVRDPSLPAATPTAVRDPSLPAATPPAARGPSPPAAPPSAHEPSPPAAPPAAHEPSPSADHLKCHHYWAREGGGLCDGCGDQLSYLHRCESCNIQLCIKCRRDQGETTW